MPAPSVVTWCFEPALRGRPGSVRFGPPFLARRCGPRNRQQTPANLSAAMRSRFLALRVRPANRNIPRHAEGSLPDC
jgi:hypothetical protein